MFFWQTFPCGIWTAASDAWKRRGAVRACAVRHAILHVNISSWMFGLRILYFNHRWSGKIYECTCRYIVTVVINAFVVYIVKIWFAIPWIERWTNLVSSAYAILLHRNHSRWNTEGNKLSYLMLSFDVDKIRTFGISRDCLPISKYDTTMTTWY